MKMTGKLKLFIYKIYIKCSLNKQYEQKSQDCIFIKKIKYTYIIYFAFDWSLIEQRHEKTCCLYMRQQRCLCFHYEDYPSDSLIRKFKPPTTLCGYTGQFASDLIGTPADRFSRDVAHILYLHLPVSSLQ